MRAGILLTPLLKAPQAPWRLVNARNDLVVADHIVPAFEPAQRRKGLLGRDHLEEGHAMIVAPSSAVHTWFMRFSIDIAFVTGAGAVLKARSQVAPWRFSACWGALAAVELPAGTLDRSGVVAGDTLSVRL